MILRVRTGARVETSQFGPGRVVRPTRDGALVSLEQFSGVEVEVPAAELIVLEEPPPGSAKIAARIARKPVASDQALHGAYDPAPQGASVPALPVAEQASPEPTAQVAVGIREDPIEFAPHLDAETAALRRSIEALRFGLVPLENIEELTLGYEELQDWIVGRLPDPQAPRPMLSQVIGPYGTGKSHAMAVIRHVAEQTGYLSAHVEVDGLTISLSEPERFLYSLWSTLSGRQFSSSLPLLDLHSRAIQAGYPPPMTVTLQDDVVRNNYQSIKSLNDQLLALDVCGDSIDCVLSSGSQYTASDVNATIRHAGFSVSPVLRRVIPNRVDQRPLACVGALSGYAKLAHYAGFKGLIITIDEFEVETNLVKAKQDNLVSLLFHLMHYVQKGAFALPAPVSIFIATVAEAGNVGDHLARFMVGEDEDATHEIEPCTHSERFILAGRIFDLYARAYSLAESFNESVVDAIEAAMAGRDFGHSGLIRAFIKRYVGTLDSQYGPRLPD
jgi:hypothetical protein